MQIERQSIRIATPEGELAAFCVRPNGPPAATGINIANPSLRNEVLAAIEQTRGRIHSVPEEELLAAQELLATKEGVGAEPTASVTAAAYVRARRSGAISANERVVVIVTGHILKAPVQVVDRRAGPRA